MSVLFSSQVIAEAYAEANKPARVTLDGKLVYEVTLLDQPTDAEVKDALEVLELKEHERPEGYVSWNGEGKVRLHAPIGGVLDLDEARAWAELLLNGVAEAEQAIEDRARDGEAA